MNLTQYLLTKVAEEASEVAKEALKEVQFGIDSQWKGQVAIKELQFELLDLMAVVKLLGNRDDVRRTLEGHPLLDLQSTSAMVDEHMLKKIQKVCFFALKSCEAGHLRLTVDEHRLMSQISRGYTA
jgi:hypothetical protein